MKLEFNHLDRVRLIHVEETETTRGLKVGDVGTVLFDNDKNGKPVPTFRFVFKHGKKTEVQWAIRVRFEGINNWNGWVETHVGLYQLEKVTHEQEG